MKRFLVVILFLQFLFPALTQVEFPFIFEGTVTNAQGLELVGANIADQRGILIQTTDFDGKFFLEVDRGEIEINISYIGYEKLTVNLRPDEMDFEDGRYKKSFILRQDVQSIGQVTISAEKIERVYDKKAVLVYDYAFHGDNLLLLIKDKKRRYLRLVDENSNTLLEKELDIKPDEIFEACIGDLMLLTEKDCYRIDIVQDIELVREGSRTDFETSIRPCEEITPSSLITVRFGKHNKSVTYFATNMKTAEYKVLDQIIDMEAHMAASFQLARLKAAGNVNQGAHMDDKGLARARQIFQDQAYYELIMTRPIYAPIFRLDKELYIFDHVNSMIRTYDFSGSMTNTCDLTYDDGLESVDEVIKDQQLDEVYAVHYRGSYARLVKIDHKTGENKGEFILDQHSFPEEIKVKNGYAYYIYQEKKDLSNPNIFRQRLSF